jgi:hypothetical protein
LRKQAQIFFAAMLCKHYSWNIGLWNNEISCLIVSIAGKK